MNEEHDDDDDDDDDDEENGIQSDLASGSKKEIKRARSQIFFSHVVLIMNFLSVCMEGEISQPSHAMILIMLSFCHVRTIDVNNLTQKID